MALDPGSFRDPDSRVVLTEDAVFRLLSERGRDDWLQLSGAALFAEATAGGTLVATEAVERDAVPGLEGVECAAVLRHERVPFVSYPYEWTFGMLRDAALLQLDLLERALAESLMLKDSLAVQRAVARRRARCSSTSARSSACARPSRGSATASSACCFSIR